MTESLSIQQARKLVLLSQKLPPAKQAGSTLDATRSAIEHLGYIQIDTISAIQRAHHHTLWNRNPRYSSSQLDQLLDDKQVFEYWSHAAAYLPMRDNLFLQGKLMIACRRNFQKVYDLGERVLPEGIDTSMPTPEELSRFMITRYLIANGLGQAAEFAYLLPKTKTMLTATLKGMAACGELLQIRVGSNSYYALPASLELLNKSLPRSKLKVLSPFDNLLIQRKRMKALFNFDYQIECYLPEAKRQYGYFSLPLLWDAQLVARMDCKADRKTAVLRINHLALEPGLTQTDAFAAALTKELTSFQQFNNCSSIQLHKTTPACFKSTLQTLFQ